MVYSSREEPTLITGLAGKQVVQVACGSTHSAAVTSEGELYSWGRGNYGRLGHGETADFNIKVTYTHILTFIFHASLH